MPQGTEIKNSVQVQKRCHSPLVAATTLLPAFRLLHGRVADLTSVVSVLQGAVREVAGTIAVACPIAVVALGSVVAYSGRQWVEQGGLPLQHKLFTLQQHLLSKLQAMFPRQQTCLCHWAPATALPAVHVGRHRHIRVLLLL